MGRGTCNLPECENWKRWNCCRLSHSYICPDFSPPGLYSTQPFTPCRFLLCCLPLLPVIPYTDLRQRCASILQSTAHLRNVTIPCLKLTAALEGLAGLSWCQVGGKQRLAVIRKELQPGQWKGYTGSKDKDYEAYLTLKYTDGNYYEEAWEECASVPGVAGLIARSPSIQASYITETGQSVQETWDGFRARVYQHEADHSYGVTLLHPMAAGGKLRLLEGLDNPQFLELANHHEAQIAKLVREVVQTMEEDPKCKSLLAAFNAAKQTQIAYRGITSKSLEDEMFEDFVLALRYGTLGLT